MASLGLRAESSTFRRGDANGDGTLDLSDGIAVLNYLFSGRSQLECQDAADANDSGVVDIADAIFLFSALFTGGPPTPPPGHLDCGSDPTGDSLS